jgi:hypothetical protein
MTIDQRIDTLTETLNTICLKLECLPEGFRLSLAARPEVRPVIRCPKVMDAEPVAKKSEPVSVSSSSIRFPEAKAAALRARLVAAGRVKFNGLTVAPY